MIFNRTGQSNGRIPAKQLLRRVGALLSLTAVLMASGLHTVALQSYCWAKMFGVYSELVTTSEAIELTLSGRDICGVCILSEQTRKNAVASLELSLSEKVSLVRPTYHSTFKHEIATKRVAHYFDSTPRYQEIKLVFDPPPPRVA